MYRSKVSTVSALAATLTLICSLCAAQTLSPAAVFNHKPEELFPLLMVPQIQKEINITSAQAEKLQARQEQMDELDEPKDANGDTRELTEDEVPGVIAKKNVMRGKAMTEILTARQQNRLQQVLAQIKGAPMLLEKSVLTALDVTEDQKKSLQEARKAAVDEMGKLRELQSSAKNASQQDRARMADKYFAARDSIVDKMVAVLTPPQQRKWRDLVGDKFTLKTVRPSLDPPTGPGPPPGGPQRP